MAWDIEVTDEFTAWWNDLTEEQQDDVAHSVGLLEEIGPALGSLIAQKSMGPVYDRHLEELRKEGRL